MIKRRAHAGALRVFSWLPRQVRSRLVRILYPTFTAGTVVALTDPDGRVLLVSQSYTNGWSLPGGLLNRNEEPADAAVRELLEELALEVEVTGHPIAMRTPWRRHYNFVFSVEVDGPDAASMRGHSPEIIDVGWFDAAALPELTEFTDQFLTAVGFLPTPPPEPGSA